jgi:hypothetical protein
VTLEQRRQDVDHVVGGGSGGVKGVTEDAGDVGVEALPSEGGAAHGAQRVDDEGGVAAATGANLAPGDGLVVRGGGEVGVDWLERQTAHTKPSSQRSRESAWRVHVLPRWGSTRVSDIKATEAQAWIAQPSTFPRITAHSLRHTYASLAVSSGANVKVVQRQMGHKSASMTLDV